MSLLLSLPAANAALTAAQKAMRTKMVTFLKEEGYVPSINDKGEIVFKVEGNTYTILLDERDTDPMFYSMFTGFAYDDIASRDKMDYIISQINFYKGIKMNYYDDSFAIGSEVYLVNIDQFRYTFFKTLSIIKTAINEIAELAQNYGTGSQSSSENVVYSNIPCTLANMFPLYGYRLGTSVKQFKKDGYSINSTGNAHYIQFGENQYWDFDGDGIVEALSIEEIPSSWASNWKMDMRWSYNDWLGFFDSQNFSIYTNYTSVKNDNGRDYLDGNISATSPDGKFDIDVYFGNGNKNGEGAEKWSKGSVNYFNIKIK